MPNNKSRLTVLDSYEILDTPAAPEFDDIVQLACQCCDTPIGLVSFVASDRQWFKARIGIDCTETPLSQSVCAIAIGTGDDLFVVPDLTKNPLTRDNPLVTGEPRLRYYAAAILRSPHGAALGTVCVLDTVPHPEGLKPEQAESLLALARQTMILLELHRALGMERSYAECA
jgi:GAF domain-containing protein